MSEKAEQLAQQFHEAYERLAPDYGYSTRKASAVSWSDVPDSNKALMIAVAGEILASQTAHDAEVRTEERERCRKAVEMQAPEMGRDINISQYREGLNDGVWRAVSAIDRLAAIRAVSEQEEHHG